MLMEGTWARCEGIIFQFFVITNKAPMVLTLPAGEEGSVLLAYVPEPVEWFLLEKIPVPPGLHHAS